jgi:hypothetical protein
MSKIGSTKNFILLGILRVVVFALCGPLFSLFGLAQTVIVPGEIPGSFSVSPSGAATYSVPIQLPPGIRGMQPQLALRYNSQSGNGIFGMGWNLSGLSTISRCPKAILTDGVRGAITYTQEDRFCLDGQRLVLTGANGYGVAGSEYRTEMDGFSKISAVGPASGNSANGPEYFRVITKGGLTMEYGNSADSRIEVQGRNAVRVWALTKVVDLVGNSMTWSYLKDGGQFYPSQISYANTKVNFETEPRPDSITMYQYGSPIALNKRVVSINVSTVGSTVPTRQYRIKYAPVVNRVQRSLVNAISNCAWSSSSAATCTPDLTMLFGPVGADGFSNSAPWIAAYGLTTGWSDSNKYPRQLVDVNGDGLPDVVGFGSEGVYVSINTGTSFNPQVRWIALYGTASGGWSDSNTYPRHLVDVNGDGLPDVVGFSSVGVYVSINTGASFNPQVLWIAAYGTVSGWSDSNKYPRQLVDVNGDGLPDVVGFGADGVYVSINTGTSFNPQVRWIAAYGTASGGWSDSNTYPRHLVDVNGDGLPDVVGFASDGVYVSINTGASFNLQARWIAVFGTVSGGWRDSNTYPRHLVDVNGDGLPDVVGFANDGVFVSLNQRTSNANLITSIVDGSQRTGWRYKLLLDPTAYTRDSIASFKSTYPRYDLQFPMQVVSDVVTNNGAGGTNSVKYQYGGLKAENSSPSFPGSGRGMLGFRWQKSLEESTGVETYTEFSQQWPYIGQVLKSETRLVKDGKTLKLKESTNQFDCRATARAGVGLLADPNANCAWQTGKVYFPFVTSSEEKSWDLNGVEMPRIKSTTSYEGVKDAAGKTWQLGDPTKLVTEIYQGSNLKHRKTTLNEYYPVNTSTWDTLGKLRKAQVTSESWEVGGTANNTGVVTSVTP